MAPMLRSEIAFGSLLVYLNGSLPKEDLERNHRIIAAIKNDKPLLQKELGPDYLARVFVDRCRDSPLESFLGRGDLLVPIPRSSPPPKGGAPWPAQRIALALHKQGLGEGVYLLLERFRATVSASRDGGARLPSIHTDSTRVLLEQLLPANRIVLVDDVVSSGATALGMARCLDQALPETEICLLAAARTVTQKEGETAQNILDPVRGTILATAEDRPPRRMP